MHPDRGVRRPDPPRGARHPRVRLGQSALLGAPGLARRSTGAAGDHGRRRGHRGDGVQPGGGARRGPHARHDHRLIRDDDTAETLLGRLADWGSKLLVDVIDHIEDGDISAIPQPEENISYAHKLTTEDGRIDWNRPAFAINRHVRGCTPAPGAWTSFADQRLKIGPPTISDERTLTPGRLGISKREVRVGTTTTDVILGDVQPVGKKLMIAADWARGISVPDDATFE